MMPESPWEWIELRTLCGEVDYVKGRCKHLAITPVDLILTGEVVAQLCLNCNTQLPAEWQPEMLTFAGSRAFADLRCENCAVTTDVSPCRACRRQHPPNPGRRKIY